jgi:hypothetical protein
MQRIYIISWCGETLEPQLGKPSMTFWFAIALVHEYALVHVWTAARMQEEK